MNFSFEKLQPVASSLECVFEWQLKNVGKCVCML